MIKTYKDWENSLGSYVKQFSPDAWELTMEAFEAGQQSQQSKIDELQREKEGLQKRIDEALSFYNIAKSDVNIGMIKMAMYLKGQNDD